MHTCKYVHMFGLKLIVDMNMKLCSYAMVLNIHVLFPIVQCVFISMGKGVCLAEIGNNFTIPTLLPFLKLHI